MKQIWWKLLCQNLVWTDNQLCRRETKQWNFTFTLQILHDFCWPRLCLALERATMVAGRAIPSANVQIARAEDRKWCIRFAPLRRSDSLAAWPAWLRNPRPPGRLATAGRAGWRAPSSSPGPSPLQLRAGRRRWRVRAAQAQAPSSQQAPGAGESSGNTVLVASTGTAVPAPGTATLIGLSDQHVVILGFIACVAVGTLSCLFLAAIPTLLAFKKAAESLEKLADAAREELPGTMAAVRLSGMEISDLTMELSDLGQEISEGVRSSARAVRAAEDGLRRMGSAASKALWQPRGSRTEAVVVLPALGYAARNMRRTVAQTRSFFSSLATVNRLSSWLMSWWAGRTFAPKLWNRRVRPDW